MDKKNITPLEKSKFPESGSIDTTSTSGCCGGTTTSNPDACCKLDEDKKAEGEDGCGCATPVGTSSKKSSCC